MIHYINQVKAILEKYEINEMNVLSTCVDNAANMTCAVRHFNDTDILESKIETILHENNVTGNIVKKLILMLLPINGLRIRTSYYRRG